MHPPFFQDPEGFLKTLGTSADGVADGLRFLGVTGRRGCTSGCPVSNALKKLGFYKLCVGTGTFVAWDSNGWRRNGRVPPPVEAFIKNFDTYRAYPDLDSEAGVRVLGH